MKNKSKLSHLPLLKFILAGTLLCLAGVAGCEQSTPDKKTNEFTLADYLCILTPSQCHGDLYKKVYLAPPDAIYEITLNGKKLKIPMGYLNTAQLLNDPSRPVKTQLALEALLPVFAPHSSQNLREFFTPYERNRISILVGIRLPGAMTWDDAANSTAKLSRR